MLLYGYILKVLLQYNPRVEFLDFYSNQLKIYDHTKICIQVFVAASFIITKTWKQLSR